MIHDASIVRVPASYRAMAFDGSTRLQPVELPLGAPDAHELLLRVHTCGVCRTDLHLVDGELATPTRPVVPGHQIVGTVIARGAEVCAFEIGDRIGASWLHDSCLRCRWCEGGRENLCPDARFTGLHTHGGYATHARVDARFCMPLPPGYDDVHAAPLLCAGLIGYRALRAAGVAAQQWRRGRARRRSGRPFGRRAAEEGRDRALGGGFGGGRFPRSTVHDRLQPAQQLRCAKSRQRARPGERVETAWWSHRGEGRAAPATASRGA